MERVVRFFDTGLSFRFYTFQSMDRAEHFGDEVCLHFFITLVRINTYL